MRMWSGVKGVNEWQDIFSNHRVRLKIAHTFPHTHARVLKYGYLSTIFNVGYDKSKCKRQQQRQRVAGRRRKIPKQQQQEENRIAHHIPRNDRHSELNVIYSTSIFA